MGQRESLSGAKFNGGDIDLVEGEQIRSGNPAQTGLIAVLSTTLANIVAIRNSGDTVNRFVLDTLGRIGWGRGGAGALDVTLQRNGTASLGLTGALTTSGAVTLPADRTAALQAATKQYVDATLTGVGSFKTAYQATDLSKTSSTAFTATDLTLSGLVNGARYAVDGFIVYQAGTTGKITLGHGLINTTGFVSYFGAGNAQTANPATIDISAVALSTSVSLGATGSNQGIHFRAYITVSGGAGIWGVQFAQTASNATATIIRAGSWIRGQRLT